MVVTKMLFQKNTNYFILVVGFLAGFYLEQILLIYLFGILLILKFLSQFFTGLFSFGIVSTKGFGNFLNKEAKLISEASGQYPKNLGKLTKNAIDEFGDLLTYQMTCYDDWNHRASGIEIKGMDTWNHRSKPEMRDIELITRTENMGKEFIELFK